MSQESAEAQAFKVVDEASRCGSHPIVLPAFTADDIAEVLAYRYGRSAGVDEGKKQAEKKDKPE